MPFFTTAGLFFESPWKAFEGIGFQFQPGQGGGVVTTIMEWKEGDGLKMLPFD
jgi:hypothetical protein